MLCVITSGKHEGKVVTLVKYIGFQKEYSANGYRFIDKIGNWWETDTLLSYDDPVIPPDTRITGDRLKPINPDHQPADQEWQADFKDLLSGDKQGVKQHN